MGEQSQRRLKDLLAGANAVAVSGLGRSEQLIRPLIERQGQTCMTL